MLQPDRVEISIGAPRLGHMPSLEADTLKVRLPYFSDALKRLIDRYPNLDLLMGSESTMFVPFPMDNTESDSKPIVFKQEAGVFMPDTGHERILRTLEDLSKLASDTNTNICPGTLCEREEIEEVVIFHETAPIISSKGEIIHLRRKFSGLDSVSCSFEDIYLQGGLLTLESLAKLPFFSGEQDRVRDIVRKGVASALASAAPVNLFTKTGNNFQALMGICGESYDPNFFTALSSQTKEPVNIMLFMHRQIGEDFTRLMVLSNLLGFPYQDMQFHGATLGETLKMGLDEVIVQLGDKCGELVSNRRLALQSKLIKATGLWFITNWTEVGVFPASEKPIDRVVITPEYVVASSVV